MKIIIASAYSCGERCANCPLPSALFPSQLIRAIDCEIEFSSKPQDYLVTFGYNPVHGVHPLKRAIQQELKNAIA